MQGHMAELAPPLTWKGGGGAVALSLRLSHPACRGQWNRRGCGCRQLALQRTAQRR